MKKNTLFKSWRLSSHLVIPTLFAATALASAAQNAAPSQPKFSAVSTEARQMRTVIIPTTQAQWGVANTNNIPANMIVRFHTNLFQRQNDVFSYVVNQLPENFPDFEYTGRSWGLYASIINVDQLSLAEAKKIISFMRELSPADLSSNRLLETSKVFDADEIKTEIIGGDRKFIAFMVNNQFSRWVGAMRTLIQQRMPEIYKKHVEACQRLGVDPNLVYIPMLGLTDKNKQTVSETRAEEAREHLKQLFVKRAQEFKEKTGRKAVIDFDFSQTPVELNTRPHTEELQPINLFAFKARDGRVASAPIGAWTVDMGEAKKKAIAQSGIIEIDVDAFVAGDPHPYRKRQKGMTTRSWLPGARQFAPTDIGQFTESVSEPLKSAYNKERANISKGLMPALVAGRNDDDLELYTPNQAHPLIAPEKAQQYTSAIKLLNLKSDSDISQGFGVYGSSTRGDLEFPGDLDLMVSSVVHVPSSINTLEEAENYAVEVFTAKTLGHFASEAKAGRLAISEMRLGSEVTMGLSDEETDPTTAFDNNPYLSQQDVLNNKYTDKNGKNWTLQQLVKRRDFMKGKVDYFIGSGRKEISLQFLLGFNWRNNIYMMRRDGLKGATSSMLRTGVYYGKESFIVAATGDRTISYYVAQRGPQIARLLGELLKAAYKNSTTSYAGAEPLWRAKYLKLFYTSLLLLRKSGAGLDEIFFEETRRFMQEEGTLDESMTLKKLVTELREAINQPELKLLGSLRRITNDFVEFSERHQEITVDQLRVRQAEVRQLVVELRRAISEKRLPSNGEFESSLAYFLASLDQITKNGLNEGAVKDLIEKDIAEVDKTYLKAYTQFEKQINNMEGRFLTDGRFSHALPKSSQLLIKTFTSLSPHFYSRYLGARANLDSKHLNLYYEIMGFRTTPADLKRLAYTDKHLHQLSREQIGALQAATLRESPLRRGVAPLTEPEVIAPILPKYHFSQPIKGKSCPEQLLEAAN